MWIQTAQGYGAQLGCQGEELRKAAFSSHKATFVAKKEANCWWWNSY